MGTEGVALVATGGYGRRELAPYSDLDLVLLHADDVDAGAVAESVWYPLWDAQVTVDHSVRALSEATAIGGTDVRVLMGLLGARHLAGDPALTAELRRRVMASWRNDARSHLQRLAEIGRLRAERTGELAHASVPDLKESVGGLRDVAALSALVATWLVDVPHVELARCRRELCDVRDGLHDVAGRPGDRIGPDLWTDLAEHLGTGEAELQRSVRELGRRVAHLSRLAWRSVDAVLERPGGTSRGRGPGLVPIGDGYLAVARGEVVLTARARPGADAHLLLRAAAEAAERGLVLSPATAARLAKECPPLATPWGSAARDLFVRLLSSGSGLLGVWETLEETEAMRRIVPEWERVRLLPHASVVHRYTVDRHLVETCMHAAALLTRVARPDVLMVAALLHDIGKGGALDHSIAGAPIAAAAARRMGFGEDDVRLVESLVRWHLLLPEVATTRDLTDPATLEAVCARVPTAGFLDLLAALAEADARATAPKAWSGWRARLVTELVERTRAAVAPAAEVPSAPPAEALPVLSAERQSAEPAVRGCTVGPRAESRGGVQVTVVRDADAAVDAALSAGAEAGVLRVEVVTVDRVGVFATVAGVLTLLRASVTGARMQACAGVARSVWDVDAQDLDPALLRSTIQAVLDGTVDLPARLSRLSRADAGRRTASVLLHPEASMDASVIEVRAGDRPALLYTVCTVLSSLGLSLRSAHVATFGPQAVDVFYVQEGRQPGSGESPREKNGPLTRHRALAVVEALRDSLAIPATLDV